VQVDKAVLVTLTQESLEKPSGIERLEEAAAELYKALQAGRDTGTWNSYMNFISVSVTDRILDMAATMERLQEYRTHNAQFCKRIFDYLSLRFTVQVRIVKYKA
jgi:exocyst complex component 1